MIDQTRTKLIQLDAERGKISSDIEQRSCDIKKLKRKLKNTEEAQIIIQIVAQKTQRELEYKISEIVSLALSAVFDDPYEFKVKFDIKRKGTEAKISFIKNEIQFNPMTATGGGVVDVAAFALRIALWSLQRPRTRNTIILDEPFKFVSVNYGDRVAQMLATISEKLNLQFIIVTHKNEIVHDSFKTFKVGLKNGISSIIEEAM